MFDIYSNSECKHEMTQPSLNPVEVNERSTMRLSCELHNQTDSWKCCRWTRGYDNASCTFEYKKRDDVVWDVEKSCEETIYGSLESYTFYGSRYGYDNNRCGIKTKFAGEYDNGTWTCEIWRCQNDGLGRCKNNGNSYGVRANINVIT